MKTIFFLILICCSQLVFGNKSSKVIDRMNNFEIKYFQNSESDSLLQIGGNENEQIIDYLFIDKNNFIQLSKKKKSFFLKIPEEDNTLMLYPLDIVPERLYKDISGNIYILTLEKVYQIKIHPTLEFTSFYTKEYFNQYISKIVVKTDNFIIAELINSENKIYSLSKINENETSKKIVEINYKDNVSNLLYVFPFNRKHKNPYLSPYNNEANYLYNQPVNSYESSLINISSFHKSDSLIYTFDLLNKKIRITNLNTNNFNEIDIRLVDGKKPQITYDEMSYIFYLSVFEKGILAIYKINLEDGTLSSKLRLNNISFEENIKINNDSLYFTKRNDSGFNKLYMVKF